MKRLNGWHRLWLVFCGSLGVLCGYWAVLVDPAERPFLFWLWLVPCLVMYVLGWAFVWIVRGFKGSGH
jgi:hypothetical protein